MSRAFRVRDPAVRASRTPDEICTLDAVSEENGTVYLLPHSRGGTKSEIITHIKEDGTNDLIGYTGSDPGDPVIVPAGSIVAFDSFVFHRSGPNKTENMRRIYLPQYSGTPITRPDGKPWAMATPFLKDGKNKQEPRKHGAHKNSEETGLLSVFRLRLICDSRKRKPAPFQAPANLIG